MSATEKLVAKNQCAVISGASSGIGAEVARRFAKEGYDLLLLGRNQARLEKVQSECRSLNTNPAQPKKVEILAFDLAEITQYTAAIQQKLSQLAPSRVLVNNAGLFHQGLLEETSTDIWFTQFQINLLASVQLTKILWPIFKNNNKGSIVNISSTLGLKPTANTGAYSALKAAMINWTQSLAQEGGAYNIRANCICPGIVDTPIHSFHFLEPKEKNVATSQMAQHQLLPQIGNPIDIAEAIYFLASDISRWTTGSVLSIDGGIGLK